MASIQVRPVVSDDRKMVHLTFILKLDGKPDDELLAISVKDGESIVFNCLKAAFYAAYITLPN